MEKPCSSFADGDSDAGCGVGCNLVVWKRATPRNRMRESLTSGTVGGLVEQSPILPGKATRGTARLSLTLN
jgi:hypothetical protein